MKAVILAAGKGTRLGKSSEMIPKPLQKIGEKAVIEHQLELLASFGITEIIILIHHLGDKIRAFLEDGKKYGVTISYIEVPLNLGTAGSVSLIQDQLVDDFLVLYADVMMKLDVLELITFHQSHPKSYGTLVVHPNSHPFDSDLLSLDDNDQITAVFPKPHRVNQYYPNVVNAALYILSPQIFSSIIPDKELDFGKDIFATLIQNKKPLFGYRTTEYLKDMGTPERLAEVRSDYESKTKMRFTKKRPAVFLDRDGVVIKQVDQLHELEKVKLLPHAGKAIHLLNKVGYLVVIITNQPMIAKGYLTYDGLKDIHNKIETLLGNESAYVDRIYFCPHHPEKGYPNEITNLKIDCDCRKPAPGLIFKAQEELNIDLSESYFIGDTTSDLLAAKSANVTSILVKTGYAGADKKYLIDPDIVEADILSAVKKILKINQL